MQNGDDTSASYVNSAMELLKSDNHDLDIVLASLAMAIETRDDGAILTYTQADKQSVIHPLPSLLDMPTEITIQPYILAYYWIVTLYDQQGLESEVQDTLGNFRDAAVAVDDEMSNYLYVLKRREIVFSKINMHDEYLSEKEDIEFNTRDANDVRRSLTNMRDLIIMENEIGHREDEGQRARSLYMLSKSVSHLFSRAIPSASDVLGLYRDYKKIEDRSIWYDLDFLRVCGTYSENHKLRLTPNIIRSILEEDLPELQTVIEAELGNDETRKQECRSAQGYGNTQSLPNIYKIVNFHRTKLALERALNLIEVATNQEFDLYNEKQRLAFCRIIAEIGECFTKKNLTEIAKKFFNEENLNALSSLRNNLTHFTGYLHKREFLLDVLRKPAVISWLEDIRTDDLLQLRAIAEDIMATLAYADISDVEFEACITEHFNYLKNKTYEAVSNKLLSIPSDGPSLFSESDESYMELMQSLKDSGVIFNNWQDANGYRREIEAKIRAINPRLLGNNTVKNTLSEIQALVENGLMSFRNDPPFNNILKLSESLETIQQEPDLLSEVQTNDRKISIINTLNSLLPPSYVFRETLHSFTEDICTVERRYPSMGVAISTFEHIELDTFAPDEDYKNRYIIKNVFEKTAPPDLMGFDIEAFISSHRQQVGRDTQKHESFLTMCNDIKRDIYAEKCIEFLVAGLQEIIPDDAAPNVSIKRQLRSNRNGIAHYDILLDGVETITYNLRYASICIKEIKPQLLERNQTTTR